MAGIRTSPCCKATSGLQSCSARASRSQLFLSAGGTACTGSTWSISTHHGVGGHFPHRYGIGLRENTVRHTRVSHVYVHLATMNPPYAQDDGLGSLLGKCCLPNMGWAPFCTFSARAACPWNVTLLNITTTRSKCCLPYMAGTRTCPWNVTLLNITVAHLYLMSGHGDTNVSSLAKIGAAFPFGGHF